VHAPVVRTAWTLVRTTFNRWLDDNVSRLAASLAYYTAFSIAPLLVIAIAVAGAVFGPEAARNEVSRQLRDLLGPAAAEAVELAVRNAAVSRTHGVVATVIGVVLLIWAATNVFTALQDSLNTIWGVKPRPDLGFWYTLRLRFHSFALVLGIAFLLLVSLVISAGVSALNNAISGGAGQELFWQLVNLGASILVFSAVFAMMFRVLPDVQVRWTDVWIGAALTALLFSVGKTLIGLYLGHSSAASVYGAAGSFVVLLIWVYYSAQILFFGAEFTQVYASHFGHSIRPNSHAIAVSAEERARQGIPREETVRRALEKSEREIETHPD
jgi:membrane protein